MTMFKFSLRKALSDLMLTNYFATEENSYSFGKSLSKVYVIFVSYAIVISYFHMFRA
jgi:hypothetical protein